MGCLIGAGLSAGKDDRHHVHSRRPVPSL
jgi:hypothetical protein